MDWVVSGTILAGKYALERKLGQGGMGAVWRAQHVQLRSPVAIKLIDQQIASNPDALGRFMREAQSAAALRSPHVVQILDFGADRGVPYIAMELLEGESLADRLGRLGRLSPSETARLMTQIARALGKAHELSIVHRDIKPDNVFIVHNDEEEVVKVLDFGIAKSTQGLGVASASATRTGAILGTPHYMSPEQAEGTKLVDHRTDLWALGVIAFECLLGRRPFESDALGSLLLAICTRPLPVPSQWGLDLPGFDAWFARACARDLSERFQTARELAAELRRVCGTKEIRDAPLSGDPTLGVNAVTAGSSTPYVAVPETASPYSTNVRGGTRRTPVVALLLGTMVLAVAVAGGVAFVMRKNRAEAAAEANAAPAQAAAKAPSTAPAAPIVAPAPEPPAPSVRPAEGLSPVASATPSASSVVQRPRAPVRKPGHAPAAAAAPVSRDPKPASSANKVNLGI